MELNGKQIIAIIIGVLSVLVGSTAQLTDLFGPSTAKIVISVASMGTSLLSVALTIITSQGATVKDVLAMSGVDKINVNASANKMLANLAVDPSVDKISPSDGSMAAVQRTASKDG